MIQGCIKYISFCLLFLFSQHAFPQYPRRANLAIIENNRLMDLMLLKECIKILNDEGFEICKFDPESHFCTTMAYPVDNKPLLVYYEFNVVDRNILLRGYIMDNRDHNSVGIRISRKSWERSAYRSFNGCIWRTGFEHMVILTEKIRSNIYGVVTWQVEEMTNYFFPIP